ncbi:MAG: coniferyl-alcohol dehydrogenase [Proteobacteria bacterium]|nr:coniferyl-alcohol dehydrogenase [Pseudomonadota bacterium]
MLTQDRRLANKTVVVTGVSSGIGKECAAGLKLAGAHVIGVDRNPCDGDIDRFVAVDLCEPGSISQCIEEIGGNIDALCNIAGLPPTAGRVPVLTANFLGLRHLTLGMIDNLNDDASIVNMASMAGISWSSAVDAVRTIIERADFDNIETVCDDLQISDARSYFLSKEALLVWTMQNRWTWRSRGVRMNCISPGPVDTPILQDFIASLGERAEDSMAIMDRPGTAQDIAPLLVFMCSDDSQWLRGANIPCDGGMSAHLLLKMADLDG